jgi:hypothetical protein
MGGLALYGRRAESRFAGALRSFTPTPINASSHTVAVPLSCMHCHHQPSYGRAPPMAVQPLVVPGKHARQIKMI